MENTHILEINLISAQRLKPPSSNLRRLETYAVVYVDPINKLRTRTDKLGGQNPTWNDKFFFRVSSEFLAKETSAVTVEIHAIGYVKDPLIGTVRLLLCNCLPRSNNFYEDGIGTKSPCFTAVQVRRASGRFQGAINIGAMLVNGAEFSALTELSAFGYREVMKANKRGDRGSGKEDDSCSSSMDMSDDSSSTASTPSRVLKDWNGVGEEMERVGTGLRSSDSGGYLCGLLLQKRIDLCPYDVKFDYMNGYDLEDLQSTELRR